MLRVLGLCALVGLVVLIVATGGRIGPLDLTALPGPLIAFATATILVLLGLRRI